MTLQAASISIQQPWSGTVFSFFTSGIIFWQMIILVAGGESVVVQGIKMDHGRSTLVKVDLKSSYSCLNEIIWMGPQSSGTVENFSIFTFTGKGQYLVFENFSKAGRFVHLAALAMICWALGTFDKVIFVIKLLLFVWRSRFIELVINTAIVPAPSEFSKKDTLTFSTSL